MQQRTGGRTGGGRRSAALFLSTTNAALPSDVLWTSPFARGFGFRAHRSCETSCTRQLFVRQPGPSRLVVVACVAGGRIYQATGKKATLFFEQALMCQRLRQRAAGVRGSAARV